MSDNSARKWFSLEEHFFKGLDQELLEKMRADVENTRTAEAIVKVTGIQNTELAEAIAGMDVTVDTLSAFRLAPLVAVAWADDRVEDNERYHITKSAEKSGIVPGEPAMELLKAWQDRRPPAQLMETWVEYAKALTASLAEAHRLSLHKEMVRMVTDVAEANGGFLGFGSISASERKVIGVVEEALS